MYTVRLGLVRSPLSDSRRKVLKSVDGALPINASIGDGDTLLQAARALRRDLLVAFVDVGLNHDTDDAGLAVADLVSNVLGYEGLVAVVLVGVAWGFVSYRSSLGELSKTTYRESSPPS